MEDEIKPKKYTDDEGKEEVSTFDLGYETPAEEKEEEEEEVAEAEG